MLFESLESRKLLHADFSVAINFQPADVPRPHGMLMDTGAVFDYRRGGYQYGWSTDITGNAVDRNLTSVQRNDTYMVALLGQKWEIAVPEGNYKVYVVAGEPKSVNERMAINVEDDITVSGVTKSNRRYLEGTATVSVTDGRLTIDAAPWVQYNKIAYVVIESVHGDHAPSVGIEASVPNAAEAGPVSGRFTITRTGDLSQPVTIPLNVSGTASNIVDYGRVGAAVTLAAGVASVDLRIGPVADSIVEGTETVIITLGAVKGYEISDGSATVSITDTPVSQGTLTWSNGPSRPQAASEIISAEIGGALYTFGGYVDNTFKPTRNAYKFDPNTNAWTAIASLPVGLTHAGVASDSNTIYFAGGYPGNGSEGNQTFSTTSVFTYTPATDSYASLPNLPVARGGGALGLVGRTLYFIGGSNSSRGDVNTVYALDLDNQGAGWVTRASLPAARNHVAAVTLNGSLYVLGGQTGQDANLIAHNNMWRYNVSNNTWTTLASMSTVRSHITDSTFILNGQIVVLAGQNAYEAPLSSNTQYNPVTNTWSALTSLPAARFSGAAEVLGDGRLIYTGGYAGGFKGNTYIGTFS